MKSTDLKNWNECCLGDVLIECRGGAWGEASDRPNVGIIRTTNITDTHQLDLTGVAWRYLPKKQLEKQLLCNGDIVMTKSNSIERVGSCAFFIQPEGDNKAYIAANFCQILRFNKSIIDPEYGFFWMISLETQQFLKDQATGTSSSLQNINGQKIKSTPFAYPNINLQRQIVVRIKECMERVDEIEGLQKSVQNEASLLPTAFRFGLWNEFAKTANLVELGSVTDSTKNGLYKPKKFHGRGIILLRMFNINGASLILDRIERLEVSKKEAIDYQVSNGDIIVSRVNSRELVGKSTLVEGLQEAAVHEAMIIRLRVCDTKVDKRFLVWLMNSPQFLHDLRGRAKHAIGQSSINQTDLLSSKLPLPSVEEQQGKVKSMSGLPTLGADLITECHERRAISVGLRGSILRKAFAGEL
jgi:type I restriction enzyme S subunit